MTRLRFHAVVASVALASMSSVTRAHNYVVKPLAEFKAGTPGYGNWVDEFKPPAGFTGDVSNGASFMKLAAQNKIPSVRAFIENRGPDCGYSNPNAKAKPVPSDGKVTLYRSMDHPGPCELYIDDTMIYHNDDCQAAFGSSTPGFSVSFDACKGSCMLRFYWLGLQDKGQRMQSYKNCIPLTGNGGGGGGGGASTGGRDSNNSGGGGTSNNGGGGTSNNGGGNTSNYANTNNANTNAGGNNANSNGGGNSANNTGGANKSNTNTGGNNGNNGNNGSNGNNAKTSFGDGTNNGGNAQNWGGNTNNRGGNGMGRSNGGGQGRSIDDDEQHQPARESFSFADLNMTDNAF